MAMFAALLLLLLLFSEPVLSRDIKEVGLTETNVSTCMHDVLKSL